MTQAIYVQWSDDGQHIRKWSREPFEGAETFAHQSGRTGAGEALPFYVGLVEQALQDYVDGTSDKTLTETAQSIIASISNPCAKIFDHKWLDPECVETGCQSLVWKSRYEAAVKGRQEFRQALRDERHQSGRTGAGEALRDQWGNSAADPFEAACLGTPITAIQSEVDRWIEAHRISFDQAMSNGSEALRLRGALVALIAECDRGQRPGGGSTVPQWIRDTLKDTPDE